MRWIHHNFFPLPTLPNFLFTFYILFPFRILTFSHSGSPPSTISLFFYTPQHTHAYFSNQLLVPREILVCSIIYGSTVLEILNYKQSLSWFELYQMFYSLYFPESIFNTTGFCSNWYGEITSGFYQSNTGIPSSI